MRKVIFLVVLVNSLHAQADYHCLGNITHFGLSDSKLNIHNGFGVHRLCNLTEDYCKAWMSLALSAEMADRKIAVYYRSATISGDQSSGSCHSIGDWVTPTDTPYYLGIR